MERLGRVAQVYGYSVCLVAIIVALINLGRIVDMSFTLADPLTGSSQARWCGGPTVTSIEAYRATLPPPPQVARGQTPTALSEEESRVRYEALRADHIARVRFDARRELTESILLILAAAALFWWHLRWVRGAETQEVTPLPAPRS